MANEEKVATERVVVENPFIDDPNAGIIVAAGDPIPVGVGIISNTPNKVDAAANMEEADAADQATTSTPATRVVEDTTSPETLAIHERVAANRSAWEQESRLGPPEARDDIEVGPGASPGSAAEGSSPEPDADAKPVDSMTGDELDRLYGDVEGYKKSAKVDEKKAFAKAYEAGGQ